MSEPAAKDLAEWLFVAGAAGVGKVRENYDAIIRELQRIPQLEAEVAHLKAEVKRKDSLLVRYRLMG